MLAELALSTARVLFTVLIHGVEIWSYGALYLELQAQPDLRNAVYFSTISYAGVGYDNNGLADVWKLVAANEGVKGVLLLGWSIAFFVTGVTRLIPL